MPAYQDLLPMFDTYWQKVKAAKEAQHVTNTELSDRSGVSASAVNKLLAGSQVDPKLFNSAAICKTLGLSLDELFGLSAPPESPTGLQAKVHELELDEAHKDAEITRLRTIVALQSKQLRLRKNSTIIALCFCAVLAVALIAYVLSGFDAPSAGAILAGEPTAVALALFGIMVAFVVAIVFSLVRYARVR